jgi:hypothetical protein
MKGGNRFCWRKRLKVHEKRKFFSVVIQLVTEAGFAAMISVIISNFLIKNHIPTGLM